MWDSRKREFVYTREQTLQLEHSLVSISKWESKWQKAFLRDEDKTGEELLDYIQCMTLTPDVDPDVYNHLTTENIEEIKRYINAPMTATVFSKNALKSGKANKDVVTSEVIYYWMITLQVPFECQYWHLNKLMTLINVCSIKNSPSKKMSRREIMSQNTALNMARRKQLNSRG
jgi:hypothetical protein